MFTGAGETSSHVTDEDDRVVIDHETVIRLGSIDVIIAYFEAADVAVPALVVEGEEAAGVA